MTVYVLDELDAIAVADEGKTGAVEWHAAQVVFSHKQHSKQIFVVEHYLARGDVEFAVGIPCTTDELERDVERGLFRRIAPIAVPSFHRVVCRTGGVCEIVHRDTLIRRRNDALIKHLHEAVRLASTKAPHEEVSDAFAAAHDVDPWSLASNLLRCGWRIECGENTEDAIDDLLEVEPDPSNFKRVWSMSIWKSLAKDTNPSVVHTRDRLLHRAREAAEIPITPDFELANPVPKTIQLKATLLAVMRRRWGFAQPAKLPHDDIASALSGSPEALARVDERLRVNKDWCLWTDFIDKNPASALDAMRAHFKQPYLIIARARCEDFLRVSRTWYTLEINNMEEREDRHSAWRSTLAKLASWTVRDIAPWRQGEQLAQAVRERCILGNGEIPNMRELVQRQFGVRVDASSFDTDGWHAVGALPRRAPPCVFLDATPKRDPLAPRFAMAHELAHLILSGRSAHKDEAWYCVTGSDLGATDDHERLANAFAAYFLAPRQTVQKEFQKAPDIESEEFLRMAMELREKFGLTAVTAGEHLLNCCSMYGTHQKLPHHIRQKLREAASTKSTHFDLEGVLPIDPMTGRSRDFGEMLAHCVKIGVVDEDKAREILPRVGVA